MKFSREDTETDYLFDTAIENIFINEYMPVAPEGYVKVYLLAHMYIELGRSVSVDSMAKTLMMDAEDVEKAFTYWVKSGLAVMDPEGIVFVSLKEKLYGKPKKKETRAEPKGKELLDNDRMKKLIEQTQKATGLVLSGTDIYEIASWADVMKATDEVILGAVKYCCSRGKKNLRYIGSVIEDWTGRGMATAEDVEKHLEAADQMHYVYRRVMKALGFSRNATEEERRIISYWMDGLGCSMDEVLDACSKTSGISNPNINYINAILKRKHNISDETGEISNAVIQQYYTKLRTEEEAAAAERKQEVAARIPRIGEIEEGMVDCSRNLTQVMISGGRDKLERIAEIRKQLAALEKEKTVLMTENDIPIDYMDVHYKCDKCRDTGVLESGARCECWIERTKEAKLWQAAERQGS